MVDFKKLTKKIFCLSLSAVLAGGSMSVALPQMIDGGITAEAASENTTADDFEWEENHGGSVTITRYTGNGGNVVIPSEIDGKSVTSIGDWAFEDCTGLTSVTIPDSVTSIGDWAFEDCTGLTSVTIPDSVKSIGNYAFLSCTGLTSVIIPDSVTSIGSWTFSYCTGLTNVMIPDSVTSIGDWAFEDCTGLTSVTIPGSVTSIGDGAFEFCDGLTSITIPDSVTSISEEAFSGCDGLTVISVDKNNKSYTSEDGVLFDKNKTTLITYPGGKKGSYTIPDSVTSIGNYAFAYCKGLTDITIPGSVTSIGDGAFFNCDGLTSVTIPDSVTSIGSWTFAGCTGLTNVMIPDSVISIGEDAFEGCTGLTSVTIPDSVISIDNHAFDGCTGLTNVTIGKVVTSIGDGAFEFCDELTVISVDKNNKSYTSEDGVLFDKNKTTLIAYPGGKKGTYSIPYSVTSIGAFAFSCCTGLTSVTIPDSVTEIGYSAFQYCYGLTNVTIPDSVTSIGDWAFEGCTGLTSVTIPESVTSIGDCAFGGCYDLTIYGKKGSYAEQYAKDNNIPFKAVVDVSVTGIKLSQTSITLEKGKTQTITATVSPSNATNKTVTWTTSNSSVATVSNGKITAKGAGTATITAKTANGKTATCKVTVKNPTVDPTSIKLNKTTASVAVGSTLTLTATVFPSNATNKTVTWSSNNTGVAKVSSKGVVTGVKAGTAVITAKSNNGKSAKATITVTAAKALTNSSTLSATSIALGNSVTVTAKATGGTTPYKYAVYYKKTSDTSWTTKQNYSTNAKVSITPAVATTYDVCVRVMDAKGTIAKKYFTVKVTAAAKALANSSTLSATSIELGKSVTVTAKASGGTTPYKYAVYYKKTTDSSWTTKQDFTTNAKVSITPAAATTYDVCVKVKDASGTVAKKYFTVKVTAAAKALTNSSTLSATSIPLGNSVTVTAKATGGTTPYKYAVYYKKTSATSWTTKQDYTTNAKVSLTPASATTYDVCVKVKDAKGTVAKKYFTVNVTNALTNSSTLSATSIALGKSVTVTAKATGGTTPYKYAVYYKKTSATSWTTKQDYTTNAKVSITPTAATTYDVCVKVKDAKGTVAKKYFTVNVTKALTNSSTLSATSISLGNSVTVTAKATGGTTPYKYAVYYKKESDTSWTTKQDYTTNAKVSITPSKATTYDVCVKVRDAKGTVAKKYFTVKVTAALTNSSTLSATSIALGNSVTVTAKATGGTTPYKYAVYYKKTSATSWTTKQDYTTNAKVSLTPASATTYDVCVKVKDAKGTVVNKDITVKVTNAALTNNSTVSASSVKLGKSVTITGKATGGTSPYKYAAYYKKSSSSTWTRIRDYGSTATMSVKPASATTYTVRVKVKDAKGTVVNKDITVKVTK